MTPHGVAVPRQLSGTNAAARISTGAPRKRVRRSLWNVIGTRSCRDGSRRAADAGASPADASITRTVITPTSRIIPDDLRVLPYREHRPESTGDASDARRPTAVVPLPPARHNAPVTPVEKADVLLE